MSVTTEHRVKQSNTRFPLIEAEMLANYLTNLDYPSTPMRSNGLVPGVRRCNYRNHVRPDLEATVLNRNDETGEEAGLRAFGLQKIQFKRQPSER